MQDFPPNSRKAKEAASEPKRVERVTSGEAVRRKRGLGERFKGTFISGDARGAAHYMFAEVIAPAIQDTMIDALQGGVERLIRGETSVRRRSFPGTTSSMGTATYKPYNQMSGGGPTAAARSGSRMLSRTARARHQFDEIIIPSRPDAEEVLERLYDLLSKFGVALVSDLYEMTGIQSSHTDVKWGWRELRGARVRPLRAGGYLLDLPEPEPID